MDLVWNNGAIDTFAVLGAKERIDVKVSATKDRKAPVGPGRGMNLLGEALRERKERESKTRKGGK